MTAVAAEAPTVQGDEGTLAAGRQPLWTQFRLGWRRTYYNMAQALGLKRLQDFLQVSLCAFVVLDQCLRVQYVYTA